jgi:hypothetical protein
MEKLEEITLYRFRVRAADGREAVSEIVASRRVPKAYLAGHLEEVLRPEDEKRAQAMLANPRWSADIFADGDHATLLVDVPGFEGHTVRFHVEHLSGEEWQTHEKLEAKVENGVAQAKLQVRHPAPGEKDAKLADLRFSCELL